MNVSFCVKALEEAIAKYEKPEIVNTDQGRKCKGASWITVLTNADIRVSLPLGDFTNHLPVTDGRCCYLNNIFVEQLWQSRKQEAVYLHKITNGFQAKRIFKNWIGFYNSERPPTALDTQTPDIAYFGHPEEIRKAALTHTRCILAKPQNCAEKRDHYTFATFAAIMVWTVDRGLISKNSCARPVTLSLTMR